MNYAFFPGHKKIVPKNKKNPFANPFFHQNFNAFQIYFFPVNIPGNWGLEKTV